MSDFVRCPECETLIDPPPCPGCSSSQGDRLTPEERGWIEAATGLKDRIKADSHMMHAAYIAQLLRIIHRLAPRPGGSEG